MSEKPFLLPCYSKLHTTALELNTFWNRKVPEFLCICILTMCKKLLQFQKEFNSVMWHSFHYDTKKIKNNEYRKVGSSRLSQLVAHFRIFRLLLR